MFRYIYIKIFWRSSILKKLHLTIVAIELMLFLLKPNRLAVVLALFYGFLAFIEDRKL